jgi:hypothetical protein
MDKPVKLNYNRSNTLEIARRWSEAMLEFFQKLFSSGLQWIFVAFGAFVLASGTTHLPTVWTSSATLNEANRFNELALGASASSDPADRRGIIAQAIRTMPAGSNGTWR